MDWKFIIGEKGMLGQIQYRRKSRNFGILNKNKPIISTTNFLKKGKIGE